MYDDYAYSSTSEMADAAGSTPVALWTWAIFILIGFYHCYMLYRIAHITGPSRHAWWAFVPIMNTVLLIKMAGKPLHWFFLLMIPFANIVLFFMLWYQVAENSGKSGFWGILCMLPPLSMIALFVLAFGNRPYEYPEMWVPDSPSDTPPDSPDRPRTPSRIG